MRCPTQRVHGWMRPCAAGCMVHPLHPLHPLHPPHPLHPLHPHPLHPHHRQHHQHRRHRRQHSLPPHHCSLAPWTQCLGFRARWHGRREYSLLPLRGCRAGLTGRQACVRGWSTVPTRRTRGLPTVPTRRARGWTAVPARRARGLPTVLMGFRQGLAAAARPCAAGCMVHPLHPLHPLHPHQPQPLDPLHHQHRQHRPHRPHRRYRRQHSLPPHRCSLAPRTQCAAGGKVHPQHLQPPLPLRHPQHPLHPHPQRLQDPRDPQRRQQPSLPPHRCLSASRTRFSGARAGWCSSWARRAWRRRLGWRLSCSCCFSAH